MFCTFSGTFHNEEALSHTVLLDSIFDSLAWYHKPVIPALGTQAGALP